MDVDAGRCAFRSVCEERWELSLDGATIHQQGSAVDCFSGSFRRASRSSSHFQTSMCVGLLMCTLTG